MVTYNSLLNTDWSRISRIKDWVKVSIIKDLSDIKKSTNNIHRLVVGCTYVYNSYKNQVPRGEFLDLLESFKDSKEDEDTLDLELVIGYFKDDKSLNGFIKREKENIEGYKILRDPEKKEKPNLGLDSLPDDWNK